MLFFLLFFRFVRFAQVALTKQQVCCFCPFFLLCLSLTWSKLYRCKAMRIFGCWRYFWSVPAFDFMWEECILGAIAPAATPRAAPCAGCFALACAHVCLLAVRCSRMRASHLLMACLLVAHLQIPRTRLCCDLHCSQIYAHLAW